MIPSSNEKAVRNLSPYVYFDEASAIARGIAAERKHPITTTRESFIATLILVCPLIILFNGRYRKQERNKAE